MHYTSLNTFTNHQLSDGPVGVNGAIQLVIQDSWMDQVDFKSTADGYWKADPP